jgi:CSLREA domain-containing protein
MSTNRPSVIFILALVIVCLAGTVGAADFYVTKTADTDDGICNVDCSLREAIGAANRIAGADWVYVPAGTFTLTIEGTGENVCATGDLDITETTAIVGEGQGNTIIDGNEIDRVFHVLGGATVVFEQLTITGGGYFLQGGAGGGGILQEGGSILLVNCSVVGNRTGAFVGIDYYGGGILGDDVEIWLSTVAGNNAIYGGGVAATDPNSYISINHSKVYDNWATQRGGGVYSGGETYIGFSSIYNNSTAVSAGAIDSHGPIRVVLSTISGNTSGGSVGGLVNSAGNAEVKSATLVDNSGVDLYVASGTAYDVTVSNTIVGGECGGFTGSITSNGGCIESPGDTCNLDVWDVVNLSAEELDLTPLGDYGGRTLVHFPRPGSRAIDLPSADIKCYDYDQRIQARPLDGDLVPPAHCDSGAVEAGPAEYLVINGNFPFDLGGWTVDDPTSSSFEWNGLDAGGASDSGSGRLSNASSAAGATVFVDQCSDGIGSGLDYELSAKLLIPAVLRGTGEAHVELEWYADPGCTGTLLGRESTLAVTSATPHVWFSSRGGLLHAPTARQGLSALVRLAVTKTEARDELVVLFDEAHLGLYGRIFADNFDYGDTDGWSLTQP